jgi:hypothetical protein
MASATGFLQHMLHAFQCILANVNLCPLVAGGCSADKTENALGETPCICLKTGRLGVGLSGLGHGGNRDFEDDLAIGTRLDRHDMLLPRPRRQPNPKLDASLPLHKRQHAVKRRVIKNRA